MDRGSREEGGEDYECAGELYTRSETSVQRASPIIRPHEGADAAKTKQVVIRSRTLEALRVPSAGSACSTCLLRAEMPPLNLIVVP